VGRRRRARVAGDEVMHAPHGDDSAAACAHSRESLRWGSAQRSQQACRQDQASSGQAQAGPGSRGEVRRCPRRRMRMHQRLSEQPLRWRSAQRSQQACRQDQESRDSSEHSPARRHAGRGRQAVGRPRQWAGPGSRGDAAPHAPRQSCPCAGAEHSPDSRHTGRDRQAAGRLRQAQAAGAR
jgi:hypothetical protein